MNYTDIINDIGQATTDGKLVWHKYFGKYDFRVFIPDGDMTRLIQISETHDDRLQSICFSRGIFKLHPKGIEHTSLRTKNQKDFSDLPGTYSVSLWYDTMVGQDATALRALYVAVLHSHLEWKIQNQMSAWTPIVQTTGWDEIK